MCKVPLMFRSHEVRSAHTFVVKRGQKTLEDSKLKLDRKYNNDTHSREYKAFKMIHFGPRN